MTEEVKPKKAPPEHCDVFGKELIAGDCVVYPQSNQLVVGTVVRLTPKMLMVRQVGVKGGYSHRESRKYPLDIAKVEGAEVTMYLLKLQQ